MNFRKFFPIVVLFVLLELSLGASVDNETKTKKEASPEKKLGGYGHSIVPEPEGTFCSGQTLPLHRYYNAQGKDHLYTTDFSELGNGNSVYVYEGVEGRCYGSPQDGTTPLYRYKNPDVQDHFYTESWSEIEAGKYGYNYQGITCYIAPEPRTGTLALYRYWSSDRTDHFYTTNWSELKAGPPSSFLSERIPGWICPRRSGDKVVTPCSGSFGY